LLLLLNIKDLLFIPTDSDGLTPKNSLGTSFLTKDLTIMKSENCFSMVLLTIKSVWHVIVTHSLENSAFLKLVQTLSSLIITNNFGDTMTLMKFGFLFITLMKMLKKFRNGMMVQNNTGQEEETLWLLFQNSDLKEILNALQETLRNSAVRLMMLELMSKICLNQVNSILMKE